MASICNAGGVYIMNINNLDEMTLIKYFNQLPSSDAEKVISQLSNSKLLRVYIEVVDSKKEHKNSYVLIDNEMNKRKDVQISEQNSTPDNGKVVDGEKNV